MSKRSLFWGNGSGKLGEAVYYRAGGEQRTRTYIKTVKNPKSYQQALQRTKFNNLVGVYKGLALAVKSFYTQREANQSPFNAFFRKNWPLNLWVADKELTSKGEGVADGFYVAVGSEKGVKWGLVSRSLGVKRLYRQGQTLVYANKVIKLGTLQSLLVRFRILYSLNVGTCTLLTACTIIHGLT